MHTTLWGLLFIILAVSRCSPLPSIKNATTQDRAASEGSNATYHCNEGHMFPDGSLSHTVTCQGGQWSIKQTHCQCK